MTPDLSFLNTHIDFLFCATIRALGFVAIWPLENTGSGMSLKFILAFALGISDISSETRLPEQVTIASIPLICSEFLFGILLALPIAVTLSLIEWWSELFDTGRGQNLGSILDPMQQSESNALAALIRTAVWILLLVSPAMLHAVGYFLSTYQKFPVGTLANFWSQRACLEVLQVLHEGVTTVIWVALPFATLFFTIEVLAAFAGKLLPHVSLSQETFVVKTLLGCLAILALGMSGFDITIINFVSRLSFMEDIYG